MHQIIRQKAATPLAAVAFVAILVGFLALVGPVSTTETGIALMAALVAGVFVHRKVRPR